MGVLTRFKDIMAANINALLDKCENPAKMIDQYLINLTEDLADVKKETAGVMAEETRTKRLLDENREQVAKYNDLAQKALRAGSEADARVFIAKKQSYEATGQDLEKTYMAAYQSAEKMREMHDKLVRDIQNLESRKSAIKAKVAVAKTQSQMNKLASSMDSMSSSMQAFDRMEDKADRMLDEANAMAELNGRLSDEEADLEAKYSGAASQSVSDELEALKAQMGL